MQKGTVSIWMSNTYKTLNIESSIKGCIGAWCPCGCPWWWWCPWWCPCGCPASRAKLLPLAPVSTHGCSDYLANREIIPLMDNKNWGLFQTVGDCIIISGNNTAIIKLSISIYLFFLNPWKLIKINRWSSFNKSNPLKSNSDSNLWMFCRPVDKMNHHKAVSRVSASDNSRDQRTATHTRIKCICLPL